VGKEAPGTQLERDYADVSPVKQAVAKSLLASRRLQGRSIPEAEDLAQMITGVEDLRKMMGAPEIVIELLDPELKLLKSGFWTRPGEAQEAPSTTTTKGKVEKKAKGVKKKAIQTLNMAAGTLEEMELNYPEGSKYWWRLRQVSPSSDYTVKTYWIPRIVREMMDRTTPKKASRAGMTRAEFLQSLFKAVPEARFHCSQLSRKQPIEPQESQRQKEAKTQKEVEAAAKVGIHKKDAATLTVKGSPMTEAQRECAAILLQVAAKLSAGNVATVALIYAATWESAMGMDETVNSAGYGGLLGASVRSGLGLGNRVQLAEAFLKGGNGFNQGGAIAYSKTHTNPAVVASQVEGATPFEQYGVSEQYTAESGYTTNQAAVEEAEAIVNAGGGAVTGSSGEEVERVKQYNFETGTNSEPNQNWWTAANRLAEEVNWELVVDGPDVYYDSQPTLAKMEPQDVVTETDELVVEWEYDWDDRQIATNLTLVLVCDELAYTPGRPIQLRDFGPASEASTIGLPGRWLIAESQRNPGDIVTTLTLIQPTQPLREPAPKLESESAGEGETAELVKAAKELSDSGIPYLYGGGHKSGIEVTGPPPPTGLDCSGSVAWVLAHAGFPPPGSWKWSDGAPVSTAFEQYGEPGPGKEITIWANEEHVFIEVKEKDGKHMQLNTSPGPGPKWIPWGGYGESDANSGRFTPRHPPGL
jgi:hypothetical protein